MDNWEKEILEKIDNGEKLTERELSELAFEFEIDRKEGDNSRWTQHITSIVELGERTFKINWDSGLTEMQENEFYYQPIEVEKKTYEKTITVTEWLPINKGE